MPTVRTSMRLGASATGAIVLALAAAGSAFAHTQTVTPPGGDPVVQGPISNPWAQAHCHANAPEVVAEASNGVVVFSPQSNIKCPLVPTPGGQFHP